MDWLRLYHCTLRCRKVQSLPDREFKAWVNMLIIASENEPRGALPSIKDVAFSLRLREDFVFRLITKFKRDGIVDDVNGVLFMHDWSDWQFKSDDINQRVAAFRKRQRNVSSNVTGNVQCNPADSDTDTDTEEEKNTRASARSHSVSPAPPALSEEKAAQCREIFARVYARHPIAKRRNRVVGERAFYTAVSESGVDPVEIERVHGLMCETEPWTWKSGAGRGCQTLEEWLNDRGWECPPAEVVCIEGKPAASERGQCKHCQEEPCVCLQRFIDKRNREREEAAAAMHVMRANGGSGQ